MDKELKEIFDSFSATINDYHILLTNHISDYSTKFGRLKTMVEHSIEASEERDKALHIKIDAYKWGLILVALFSVISLGGFVTLSILTIIKLMGG